MPKEFLVSLLVLLLFVAGPAAQGQEPRRATAVTDTRILLETGAFDPLRGPQSLPSGLRLASEAATERWIVQFKAPLTRDQRAALTRDAISVTRRAGARPMRDDWAASRDD